LVDAERGGNSLDEAIDDGDDVAIAAITVAESISPLRARAYANSPLPCMNRSPSTSSFSAGIESSRSPSSRVAFV
jgi:hypothetical protein